MVAQVQKSTYHSAKDSFKENALDNFSRIMAQIDAEVNRLDEIELTGKLPVISTQSARVALLDLKRKMEEDDQIGRQLLAV